ncbi:pilus assembly protein TadG-related protein [Streptomyces sp. TR06-5]|uniref:pilus assembly protein TadG-related protein n=1 Tax=Streptomyces sp. TR06-5 TaxID=3385976 RepID=UPI0039A1BB1A
MTPAVPRREAGQTLPIYLTVVVGVLFLALAYFAVGQAAVARDGARSAADAAALAAAKDARGQLGEGLLDSLLDPDSWEDLLAGRGFGTTRACAAAQRFAAQNDAELHDTDGDGLACRRVDRPDAGFTVEVRSRNPVGDSIVPGTENDHAEAAATAVLEPRCRLKSPPPGGRPPGGDEKEKKPKLLELRCHGGRDLVLDPEDEDLFLDPADLFSVHLTG